METPFLLFVSGCSELFPSHHTTTCSQSQWVSQNQICVSVQALSLRPQQHDTTELVIKAPVLTPQSSVWMTSGVHQSGKWCSCSCSCSGSCSWSWSWRGASWKGTDAEGEALRRNQTFTSLRRAVTLVGSQRSDSCQDQRRLCLSSDTELMPLKVHENLGCGSWRFFIRAK